MEGIKNFQMFSYIGNTYICLMQQTTLVIHGGAGTIVPEDMTPSLEQAYHQALQEALQAGNILLQQGKEAVLAVKAAVESLENNILFNAGKGSVFTHKAEHEMDAAIMCGKTFKAGSVAGVKYIKNPIELAYAITQKSSHVFLCSQGALDFAIQHKVPLAGDDYFFSEFRYNQLQAIKDTHQVSLDHNVKIEALLKDKKFGTVGAVACDVNGNIAAATSTGGMTNKKYGRIGDSPIIGAGTYANNATCAISCTGHGEPFMQAVAAYDVSCLMEYKGYTLQQAMQQTVHQKLVHQIPGEGGMIGVDAKGNFAMDFNTAGMYRGVITNNGINVVKIYK